MQEKEQETTRGIPLIGESAPKFKAQTTMGPISFPADYKDKWAVLFSHPADFTPVCTTEFLGFQDLKAEFDKYIALLNKQPYLLVHHYDQVN